CVGRRSTRCAECSACRRRRRTPGRRASAGTACAPTVFAVPTAPPLHPQRSGLPGGSERAMNWAGTVRTFLVCVILVVFHYTLRARLAWRASVDFLLVALLLGSVRLRPGYAAVYGFFLGLVADSLAATGFGVAALGMSVVGFSASWLKAVFFADNLALN